MQIQSSVLGLIDIWAPNLRLKENMNLMTALHFIGRRIEFSHKSW